MKKENVLKAHAMPAFSPSYYKGPYRFIDREFFIISYKTDLKKIEEVLPEPLESDGTGLVKYEFIRMPDSYGFGAFHESGLAIPCLFKGKPATFSLGMNLDAHAPLAGGREIWGFPKKRGKPAIRVEEDTLIGTLEIAGERVAMGTMPYKINDLLHSKHNYTQDYDPKALETLKQSLESMQINLKLIPSVTGKGFDVAQLVSYRLQELVIKGAWSGEGRLHLIPHVQFPVSDFPVLEVIKAYHYILDFTLPYGDVLFDYLKDA